MVEAGFRWMAWGLRKGGEGRVGEWMGVGCRCHKKAAARVSFEKSRCWDWICGDIGGGTGLYFELW
jgi:hypothetical protein